MPDKEEAAPIVVSYWWCEVWTTVPRVLRAPTKKALEEISRNHAKVTKPRRVHKIFPSPEALIEDISNYPSLGLQRIPMWEKGK